MKTQGTVDPQGQLRLRMGQQRNREERLGKRMEELGKRRMRNLVQSLENKGKHKDPCILRVDSGFAWKNWVSEW